MTSGGGDGIVEETNPFLMDSDDEGEGETNPFLVDFNPFEDILHGELADLNPFASVTPPVSATTNADTTDNESADSANADGSAKLPATTQASLPEKPAVPSGQIIEEVVIEQSFAFSSDDVLEGGPDKVVDAAAPEKEVNGDEENGVTKSSNEGQGKEKQEASLRPELIMREIPKPVHYDKPWHERHQDSGSSVVRVFFSSPFGGMEDERTKLTKMYFPEIKAMCENVGLTFVPVDLRWGITEKDAGDAMVLQLCLKEIDRSDIFIGFYGARYGWHDTGDDELLQRNFAISMDEYPWLVDFQRISITEVEFEAGFFQCLGKKPSAFFFRADEYDEQRREEYLRQGEAREARKYSPESDDAEVMRKNLKKRVQLTAKQMSDVPCQDYESPEEGARFMFDELKKLMTPRIELAKKSAEDEFNDPEAAAHAVYMNLRSDMFLGYENYMHALDDFIAKRQPVPLVVTGAHGTGKTSLLSRWLRTHIIAHSNRNTGTNSSIAQEDQQAGDGAETSLVSVHHFVGCSSASTTLVNVLQRSCQQLATAAGREENVKELDVTQLKSKFNALLEDAAEKNPNKKFIIMIDALDELMNEHNAYDLSWLPETVPVNAWIIISAVEGSQPQETAAKKSWPMVTITNLDEDLKREIVDVQLKIRGKNLSDAQKEMIFKHHATHTPLYLIVLTAELCSFGVFEQLTDKIEECLSANNSEELFVTVLKRLDEDFKNWKTNTGESAIELMMSLLVCARHGVSEAEIKTVLGIIDSQWSRVYFAVEELLVVRSGLLCIKRVQLRNAIIAHYNLTSEKKIQVRGILADYFKLSLQGIMTPRVVAELPWLLEKTGKFDELRSVITNPNVFGPLCEQLSQGNYDMIRYWNSIGDKPEEIASSYMQSIELQIEKATSNSHMKLIAVSATRIGQYLAEAGHFLQAIQPFRKALELKERIYGPNSKQVVETLADLARLASSQGDLASSKSLYERALNAASEHFDKDSLTLANIKVGFANVLKKQDMFEDAMDYLQQALSVYLTQLSPQHLDVGLVKHNLADLLSRMGLNEDALAYYKEALSIRITALGSTHPSTSSTLNGLGAVYLNLGDVQQAQEAHEAALRAQEEVLGRNNPETASTIAKLAFIAYAKGDVAEAKALYREALEILQAAFGEDHPALCEILDQEANLMAEAGDVSAALSLYKRSLAIKEGVYGKESGALCETMYQMAQLLAQSDKVAEGLAYIKRVAQISKNVFGDDHPLTQDAMEKQHMLEQFA